MILLRQVRQFLISIGLVVFVSTVISFSFVAEASWATPSFTQGIAQLHPPLATMDPKVMTKTIEGKAQEQLGNITDNPKNQVDGQAKQLEAKTRTAINDSIESSEYQPGGKTKQAEKLDRQARGDIRSEVRGAFK